MTYLKLKKVILFIIQCDSCFYSWGYCQFVSSKNLLTETLPHTGDADLELKVQEDEAMKVMNISILQENTELLSRVVVRTQLEAGHLPIKFSFLSSPWPVGPLLLHFCQK